VVINFEKTKRQGSKQLLFGSFQNSDLSTSDVVIKLKTKGRHLAAESQLYDTFRKSEFRDRMLKCFNGFGQADPDYLVLEDFGSDLRSAYLHDSRVRSSVLVANIVEAVSKLHQLGIVHGDLKPENILVSSRFQCKLCDFDSACQLNAAFPRTPQGELKFSFGWVSPEVFKAYDEEKRSHSKTVLRAQYGMDIFPLGLIVDLLCRKSLPHRDATVLPNPQNDSADHSVLRTCLSSQKELDALSHCLTHDHAFGDLVGTMLSLDPKNRETSEFYLTALSDHSRTGFYRKTKKQQSDLDLLADFKKNFTSFRDQHQSSLTTSHSLQLDQIRSDILTKLESYHSSMKELNEKVDHLSTVTVTAIQQSWEEAKSELKGHTSAELSNVIETLDSRMSNLENNVCSSFEGSLQASMIADMNLCLVGIARTTDTNNEATPHSLGTLEQELLSQKQQLAEITNNIHETHLKLLTNSDDMFLKLVTLETVMNNSFAIFSSSIGAAQTNGELKAVCDEMKIQIEGKVMELFSKMEKNLQSQAGSSDARLAQVNEQLTIITRLAEAAATESKESKTDLQTRQNLLQEALAKIDGKLREDVVELDTKLLTLQAAIYDSFKQELSAHQDSLVSQIDSVAEKTEKRVEEINGQQLDLILAGVRKLGDGLSLTEEELKKMISQTKDKIQSVQNFQHLSAFNAHSHPLLFILSEERIREGLISSVIDATQVVRQGYRIHFLCTVCGKMAPSGRNNSKEAGSWTRLKNSLSHVQQDQGGYRLLITHKWVAEVLEGMKWILRALQFASRLSGFPLPHLSECIEILPVPDQLREMSDEILKEVVDVTRQIYKGAEKLAAPDNSNEGKEIVNSDRDDVIDDTNRHLSGEERKRLRKSKQETYDAMTIEQLREYWILNRPKVTLPDVKLVRQLLELVNDSNVEHTGLRRCLRQLDGTCAWVCEGNERSGRCEDQEDQRSCFELYQAEGSNSCLINMEYV
jgi:serine/threonine protein kinase